MGRTQPTDQATLWLPKKTVQIWVLPDAAAEKTCRAMGHVLSLDERLRANSYKQEKHRTRFIYRRCALRWLMARYLGCAPESLQFGLNPFGKPGLCWPSEAGLRFSVSQTEGIALLAFTRYGRVGVDVEQLAGDLDITGMGQGVFSCSEHARINAAKRDDREIFFSIWTRKEALLKAIGTGFSGNPTAYSTQDEGPRDRNRWCGLHNGTPLARWTFLDLALGPGVYAALAVSCANAKVSIGLF